MIYFNYHCKPMNYAGYFMNKIRYMVSFLLSLGALVVLPSVSTASFPPVPDSTKSVVTSSFSAFVRDPVSDIMNHEESVRAGLLYDMDRKVVVWEKDMNYAYPVASLTKMMVALLAMEDVLSGKACWEDEVIVTREYYRGRKHRTKYTVKEKFTLDELVRLAMVSSNNEATVWIGKELAGGTLEPFIRRMNEKCALLGMEHTFYSNPSGLPAISGELDNSSSPNDLLVLALELIKYPELLKITSMDYVSVAGKKHLHRNHNGLVIQYPGEVDGLKTGYTKNARFCLVATANRGGRRLVSIVLGASSPFTRNEIVADMMNNYFQLLGLGKLGDMVVDPALAQGVSDSLDQVRFANPLTGINLYDDTAQQGYRKYYVKTKKYHVVRKGETIYSIAGRYDCYAGELKKWNRLKSTRLNAGQRLVVYQRTEKTLAIGSAKEEEIPNEETTIIHPDEAVKPKAPAKAKASTPAASNTKKAVPSKSNFVYHIVQPGDTLWNIAQKFPGTTVDKIKKVNGINNSKNLRPGTKLKIQVNS